MIMIIVAVFIVIVVVAIHFWMLRITENRINTEKMVAERSRVSQVRDMTIEDWFEIGKLPVVAYGRIAVFYESDEGISVPCVSGGVLYIRSLDGDFAARDFRPEEVGGYMEAKRMLTL